MAVRRASSAKSRPRRGASWRWSQALAVHASSTCSPVSSCRESVEVITPHPTQKAHLKNCRVQPVVDQSAGDANPIRSVLPRLQEVVLIFKIAVLNFTSLSQVAIFQYHLSSLTPGRGDITHHTRRLTRRLFDEYPGTRLQRFARQEICHGHHRPGAVRLRHRPHGGQPANLPGPLSHQRLLRVPDVLALHLLD